MGSWLSSWDQHDWIWRQTLSGERTNLWLVQVGVWENWRRLWEIVVSLIYTYIITLLHRDRESRWFSVPHFFYDWIRGRGRVISDLRISSVYPSIFFCSLSCWGPLDDRFLTLIPCDNPIERNRFLKIEIYQKLNIFNGSGDLNSFSQKNIDPSQELTKNWMIFDSFNRFSPP